MVNGGLGLQLAGNDGASYKAYIAIAVLVYAVYLFVVVWSTVISRRKEEGETGISIFGTRKRALYDSAKDRNQRP